MRFDVLDDQSAREISHRVCRVMGEGDVRVQQTFVQIGLFDYAVA